MSTPLRLDVPLAQCTQDPAWQGTLARMKTGACPKCNHREVYEIEEALVPDYRYSNSVRPFTVTAAHGPFGKNMKDERIAVHVAAFVCASCAYSELYARDLAALETLARSNAGNVRKAKR